MVQAIREEAVAEPEDRTAEVGVVATTEVPRSLLAAVVVEELAAVWPEELAALTYLALEAITIQGQEEGLHRERLGLMAEEARGDWAAPR